MTIVIAFRDREILAIGRERDPRAEPWVERIALEEPGAAAEPGGTDPARAALAALAKRHGADAAILALKTGEALPNILRTPPAEPEEMRSIVELKMTRIAPFAGEEISGGHEILRRDEQQCTVLAAAAPVKILDPLIQCVDAAGLRIERIDLTILGLWRRLKADNELSETGRTLVLARLDEGWDLLICDDGFPALLRHLPDIRSRQDLLRELSITLPRLEMETAASDVVRAVIVAPKGEDTGELEAAIEEAVGISPSLSNDDDPPLMALRGMLQRTSDEAALDLTPEAWRRRETGKRSRRRFLAGMSAGVLLWVLLNAVLFLGPSLVTARVEAVRRQAESLAPEYNRVAELRNRIRMIQRHTDRSNSLLECLREITVMLPEGITLTQFTYRRDEDVTVSGEAYAPSLVYAFKEQIDESPIFSGSRLTGPRLDQARQRHIFELQIFFPTPEP